MISIVIPVYNDEKFIEECLHSVQKQTFKDFECICLDDGSSDETVRKINEIIQEDNRFVLYQNNHKGPGWERNYGISIAKGEYLTFMDHDDFVEPEWLESLYNLLVRTGTDIAYCSNADYFDDTKEIVNYHFPENLPESVFYEAHNVPEMLTCEYFAPWRRLVKRNLVVNNNVKFAEGHFKFDDVLFTQELIENSKSASFCDKILYYHRIFSGSITGKGMVNRDMFFEHFDTANEVIRYSKENGKDTKLMLERMFGLFNNYLFYVDSRFRFFCKMTSLVIKNRLSLKYRIKMVYNFFKLIKFELMRPVKRIMRKVKY